MVFEKIEMIKNENNESRFLNLSTKRYKINDISNKNSIFKESWRDKKFPFPKKNEEIEIDVDDILNNKIEVFDYFNKNFNEYKLNEKGEESNLMILKSFNGLQNENVAKSICSTGFAIFRKLDAGFFGAGVYNSTIFIFNKICKW
jgi:hypothetical protein